MFNVLILEDDMSLNKSLCRFLQQSGFSTTGCFYAEEAYDAMYKTMFDLIISDIMMPGIDGYEFVRNVRALNTEIPVLFLTARDDLLSKQLGFLSGIDDYLVKPVEFEELLLHIHALLRRAKISSSKRLVVGSFLMDISEHTATLNGEEIALTKREFNILYKLLSYPKKTFTRQQLMDEFWDPDSSSGIRTVDVYMVKLRNKLAACKDFEIQTVHGLGYRVVIK